MDAETFAAPTASTTTDLVGTSEGSGTAEVALLVASEAFTVGDALVYINQAMQVEYHQKGMVERPEYSTPAPATERTVYQVSRR
ncbi:MAG: hypothetical protein KGJ86_00245 [Chloroflexota bacterium]|nr:hypothetical protein [Chloroflexota bacterium]